MKPGWRLAGLGLLFIGFFTVLGLRLWYLQVTSIDSALSVAQSQQLRIVEIEPARGDDPAPAPTHAAMLLCTDSSAFPVPRPW